jgi:hypothetical protein
MARRVLFYRFKLTAFVFECTYRTGCAVLRSSSDPSYGQTDGRSDGAMYCSHSRRVRHAADIYAASRVVYSVVGALLIMHLLLTNGVLSGWRQAEIIEASARTQH